MDTPSLQSQRLDHLGIVAGICNEIGLIETIDGRLEDSVRKVSYSFIHENILEVHQADAIDSVPTDYSRS